MRRSSSDCRRHFPALDGLRALAVLAVIWHHSTPWQLSGVLGRGHLGVQLFFCISGFLITTLLLDELSRTGELRVGAFYWRRALRILPLYYGVLSLFTVHAALSPDSAMREHFFANLPAFASGTTTWFVSYRVPHPVSFGFSWSLATELQFYVVWPLLLLVARTPRRALLALAAMITVDQAAEHRLLNAVLAPRSFEATLVKSFSTSLGLGAALALLAADVTWGPWLKQALSRRAAPLVLSLLSAALVVRPVEPFIVLELVLATWVAAVALAPARAGSWLATGPLPRVGRLSYAMYLFHVPIIGGMRRAFPGLAEQPVAIFLLALAPTLALAELSARFVERPLLALRAGFRERTALASSRAG